MPGDGKEENDALVSALVNPRKPMENKPTEEVEPVVEPAKSKAAEAVDAETESTGELTDSTTKDKPDDVTYLKSQLGRQSNELGDLRKRVQDYETLLASQPRTEPTETKPSAAEEATARFSEKYTEEFGKDMQDWLRSQMLPLQAKIVVQELRAANPDFDELAPEMDRVLRERPHLASVVSQDLNTLEDVLLLARARKGTKALASEKNRIAAETEEKEREKRAAVTERPSKAASKQELEATPQQVNQAWAAQIATMRNPNRSV